MISNYKEFKGIHKNHKIEMTNDNFTHIIYGFQFILYPDEKLNKHRITKINEIYNQTYITIVDQYQDTDTNYLILCFQKKLIIISISELNLFQDFFINNSQSIYYPLSSIAKNILSDNLPIDLKFSKKKDFEMEDIKTLSGRMQVLNKEAIDFWKIIKLPIACYLLMINYRKKKIHRFKIFKNFDKKNRIISLNNNDYIKLREIGLGSSSIVYLIYHIQRKKLYALKVFLNIENNNESNELFEREKMFYSKIKQHPLLSKYYGCTTVNSMNALMIEYINGQSLNSIKKLNLNFNQKIKIIFQILIVVEFIHQNKMIYRDLKPNNFIIDSKKTVVLIDRDRMTEKLNQNETGELTKSLFQNFLAPEIQSSGKFSYEADIYSIGVLIYFIIMEKEPEIEYDLNYNPIISSIDEFPDKYFELKNIFKSCIEINPIKRPKISDIIDFVYINYLTKFTPSINETETIKTTPNIHSIKYCSYWYYLSESYHSYCQYKLGYLFQEGLLFKIDMMKAIKYLEISSNNLALFQLGEIYREGKFVKKDIDKAIKYYKMSADLDYKYAYYFLGNIYVDVRLERFNISKALYYLKIAAIRYNILRAQINLGILYRDGEYVIKNLNKSIYYFKLGADQDETESQLNLAFIYIFFKKDAKKAVKYTTLAANKNDPTAQFMLGSLYFDGIFIKRDMLKSIFYLKKASSNGISKAQSLLGKIFFRGYYVPRDVVLSEYYFELAAKNNDFESMRNLGVICLYEKKVYNVKKAIHYLTISAKYDTNALVTLGDLYYKKDYGVQNLNLAFHYYSIAANKSSIAQFMMGVIYLEGKIVEQNINKALYYVNLSAKQNNKSAQYMLAKMYYTNKLIPRNISKSIYYYNLCKDDHDLKCLFELATIYTEGKYVKRDISKAIHLYKEASSFNDQYSKNNLGIIFKNGLDTEKNISYAIELFREAIYQKNDIVAMYNLAHLYFFEIEFKEKIDDCIKLLIRSANDGYLPSLNLLCLWILKNNYNSITKDEIMKKLELFGCSSFQLANELFGVITDYFLYIPKYFDFYYNTYKKKDFLYDVSLNYISFDLVLHNNEKIIINEKRKYLTEDFYKGFGLVI